MPSKERIDALPPGSDLQSYITERVLGSGAFGITYLAKHRMLETWHVIKEYLPDCGVRELNRSTVSPKSASDKDLFDWGLKSFREEARLLHKLSHPHIIKVTDLFEANSTAYFVMPYLRGITLHEWIKQHPSPSQDELEAIFVPLIEGLKYIHAKGLLHRDIKPENIYLLKNSHPILIDFGSARIAIGQKSKALTQVLTPHFAPIEQYASKGTFTPAMDLYGLAGCIYQAITGELPEEAPNRLVNDEQPRLAGSGYEKRYAGHFLQSIDKSLSVYARDRHQDGFELQKDLVGHKKASEPSATALNDSPGQNAGKASPERMPPQLQNPSAGRERFSDDQPERTLSRVESSSSKGDSSEGRTVLKDVYNTEYTKLGQDGVQLPDEATQAQGWLMTRDNETGRIWEVKTLGNKDEKFNWRNARTVFIARLNQQRFGGFNDWRLPKIHELETLIQKGQTPTINSTFFPNTGSSAYWSATSYASYTYYAWHVNFNYGSVFDNSKSHSYYVRAVRAGQ